MITLTDHITRYVATRRALGGYNAKSQRVVAPRLHAFARHFGGRPLCQLTERAVVAWLADLEHLSPNSRAAYLSSLRSFTRWLHSEGIVAADPCAKIPNVRRARPVPRALPPSDVRAVIDACGSDRDRAVIWLMVGLGLRRMEVAGLRWEHVDQRAGLATIHGKGGVERVLPITAEVAAALAPLRRAQVGPVIRSHRGGALSVESVGRIASRAFAASGVRGAPRDGASGHALRHTAASDVLDACGDLRVVQQMLGHAQLATTSIYLRRASADSIRAAMAGRTYRAAALTRG